MCLSANKKKHQSILPSFMLYNEMYRCTKFRVINNFDNSIMIQALNMVIILRILKVRYGGIKRDKASKARHSSPCHQAIYIAIVNVVLLVTKHQLHLFTHCFMMVVLEASNMP